jgi:CubicO group peptidase (beta-lactamase class C family)
MTTQTFPATTARVEHELSEYRSALGAQVVVVLRGERVLSLAEGDDGTGRPLDDESIFRVYCTMKPCLAVLIARLCDDEVLDLDDPLELVLGRLPVLEGGVTLRHLLLHTAGLGRPLAFEMELIPPHERRLAVEGMSRPADFRLGVDAAYSEYAAWQIAGWAVEAATGEPLRATLRAWFDRLGLRETWIGMTDEEYRDHRPRIGVNHDHRGARPLPMGLEPGRRWCTEVNPAHGGYTTMRDLARFYALVLAQLRGAGHPDLPAPATLDAFCSVAREPVYDRVLDRVCPFGLGFMVSLGEHLFGEVLSPTSFGHSGYAGASFALADPEHDLVVAALFNGIVDHNQAFQRRTDLLRAIARDRAANANTARGVVSAAATRPL